VYLADEHYHGAIVSSLPMSDLGFVPEIVFFFSIFAFLVPKFHDLPGAKNKNVKNNKSTAKYKFVTGQIVRKNKNKLEIE